MASQTCFRGFGVFGFRKSRIDRGTEDLSRVAHTVFELPDSILVPSESKHFFSIFHKMPFARAWWKRDRMRSITVNALALHNFGLQGQVV